MRGNSHVRFGSAGRGDGPSKGGTAPRPDTHYWAADLLAAEGAQVHLVHPLGFALGQPAGQKRRQGRHRARQPAASQRSSRGVDLPAGGAANCESWSGTGPGWWRSGPRPRPRCMR